MKLGQIPDSGQEMQDPSKRPLKERGGIPDQEHPSAKQHYSQLNM